MLTITRFKDVHIPYIKEWLEERELPTGVVLELPAYGLIAIDDAGPICAAFLRLIEGKFCLFDGLVSNPGADAITRDKALNALTKQLIQGAKDLGMRKILGLTVDDHTVKRAMAHGYEMIPYTVMSLSLEG